jgi:1-aminocyclopropane-1-carboxylate deaminase/D-cysteine desulfhydrase-like pyridoxal-dependent ACC family enzyme
MSHHEESDQVSETTSAAGQTEGPAVGGNGEPVAQQGGEPVAQESDNGGAKGKAAVAAAGTGAAVAGIAGGIAVAARDTRRRVLGIPVGKRSRFQRTASTVVDKAKEPARKLGSRFSRD